MTLAVFLKCRLIKQFGKDMEDTHILGTLPLLSYKVAGVLDRDFSSNLDKEDILRMYAKDLPIVRTTTRRSNGPQNVTQLTMDQPSRFEG